jgi:predicted dehydrogenase
VLTGQIDLTRCPADQRPLVQETLFERLLVRETVTVERGNAILEEQREFVDSIRRGTPVRVSGEQGREALAVAERILSSMAVHQWNGTDHIGSLALFLPTARPARRAA